MNRKILYVTSSGTGTVATHNMGWFHNFESVPHEMRVHEIICNKEGLHTVGPEEVSILYLIPVRTVTNNFPVTKISVMNEARSAGTPFTEVSELEFPGYINSVIRPLKQPFRKTRLVDFVESSSSEKATFNEIEELITKVNRYLAELSPRWSRNDYVPQLVGRSRVQINPGRLQFPNNEYIYTIPLFGPKLRKLLGLYEYGTPEFKKSMFDFIYKREPAILNGPVSEDHFIDHFFTVKCNLVQNKISEGDEFGILFAWIKNPELQTDVIHIKNKSDCWIPVEKIPHIKHMKIIIGTSTDQLASFVDDFTLVVIELRRRGWKELST